MEFNDQFNLFVEISGKTVYHDMDYLHNLQQEGWTVNPKYSFNAALIEVGSRDREFQIFYPHIIFADNQYYIAYIDGHDDLGSLAKFS